jgi:hypothetical protein
MSYRASGISPGFPAAIAVALAACLRSWVCSDNDDLLLAAIAAGIITSVILSN